MVKNKHVTRQGLTLIIIIATLYGIGLFLPHGVWAGEPAKAKGRIIKQDVISETINPQSVSGVVSYIDSKTITIVYQQNSETGEEWEIGFSLKDAYDLNRKNDISQIQVGDTLQIDFNETEQEVDLKKDDGTVERMTKIHERKISALTFLRPAEGSMTSR